MNLDERPVREACPDRHSLGLSELLRHLTLVVEMLSADAQDRSIHRIERWEVARLAITGVDAYGRLLSIHEVQVELDRTRSQLAELQARWDQAKHERGQD